MNFLGKAKNILKHTIDCIFPRCCTICNRRSDLEEYCNLCSSCIAKIPWIKGPGCALCSRSMADGSDSSGEELICAECRANVPHFKSGMSCWRHTGTGRDIILALKYRNADFLKKDIGVLLKNNCPKICEFAADSLLVPVPIHYFRRVKRGYNQAEVIAQAVAKISKGSTVINALKSKNKKSQTRLKSGERLLNVKNMFECSTESANMAKDRRVVLVDDVSTTGATVRECCKVLYDAGFEDLHVLTLAHG